MVYPIVSVIRIHYCWFSFIMSIELLLVVISSIFSKQCLLVLWLVHCYCWAESTYLLSWRLANRPGYHLKHFSHIQHLPLIQVKTI